MHIGLLAAFLLLTPKQKPPISVFVGSVAPKPGVFERAIKLEDTKESTIRNIVVEDARLFYDEADPVFQWYHLRSATWKALQVQLASGGTVDLKSAGTEPAGFIHDMFGRLVGVYGVGPDTGSIAVGLSFQVKLSGASGSQLAWSPKEQLPPVTASAGRDSKKVLYFEGMAPLTGKSRAERYFTYLASEMSSDLRKGAVRAAIDEFERIVDTKRDSERQELNALIGKLIANGKFEELVQFTGVDTELDKLPKAFRNEFEDHIASNYRAFGLSDENQVRMAALKAGGLRIRGFLTFTVSFMMGSQATAAKIDMPISLRGSHGP